MWHWAEGGTAGVWGRWYLVRQRVARGCSMRWMDCGGAVGRGRVRRGAEAVGA